MKKLTFILLLSTIATGTFAQMSNNSDSPKSKIGIGFKAGVNLANVSTDFSVVADNQKMVTRFHGGLFYDIKISDNFLLQPQLLYNGKGLYFTPTGHSHDITMHSIDLPIYALYKTNIGFFVGVAPNFGYNISGKNVTKFPSKTETVDYKFNDNPFEYKRFDFGASLMLGYEHASGISLSINYLKGLNKVANLPDNTWSSNVLAFSLGYKL